MVRIRFVIFFMGCFFYVRNEKNFKKLMFLLPLAVIGGAILYRVMYPLKMMIRTGSLNFEIISFTDALMKFITRLSPFSNACVVFERVEEFINAYQKYGRPYSEIIYYFNAWTPSFLYDKTFLPLNKIFNLVLTGSTSGNFDLSIAYYYLLLKIGLLDLFMYFSIVIINCYFHLTFTKLFKGVEIFVHYGYITGILFMFSSGVVPLLNHGTWIPQIWNIVLLLFLGCFVIRRKGLDDSKFQKKSIFAYIPANNL